MLPTVAADGPAGLAALERFAPDLMLVDFAMPGMNGAEVARAARLTRPDLPIIFASGYAETAAIEDAAGRSAVILRKPFRIDDLGAVLAAALDRPGMSLATEDAVRNPQPPLPASAGLRPGSIRAWR